MSIYTEEAERRFKMCHCKDGVPHLAGVGDCVKAPAREVVAECWSCKTCDSHMVNPIRLGKARADHHRDLGHDVRPVKGE